jgi:hypothetical protein
MALFQQWNMNMFKSPISISRSCTMPMSKIGSQNTYHKCLKDLNCWGYISYVPSRNPIKGSLVYLFSFDTSACSDSIQVSRNSDTSSNQVAHISSRKSDKCSVEVLRPSINNINNIENINNTNNILIDFEDFWNAYDKKVGNKEILRSKWDMLNDCEREAAMKYIPLYIQAQPDKKFRKNPENFLDNHSWNDEIIDCTANLFLPNIM